MLKVLFLFKKKNTLHFFKTHFSMSSLIMKKGDQLQDIRKIFHELCKDSIKPTAKMRLKMKGLWHADFLLFHLKQQQLAIFINIKYYFFLLELLKPGRRSVNVAYLMKVSVSYPASL